MIKYPMPIFVTNVRAFLGLTGYYRNYVKRYSYIRCHPSFKLTKNNIMFMWTPQCQNAYNVLKDALVKAPILVRPNVTNAFILDVGWSTKGVGVVLSQKEGRFEQMVAYATKVLSPVQKKFHPMGVNVMH